MSCNANAPHCLTPCAALAALCINMCASLCCLPSAGTATWEPLHTVRGACLHGRGCMRAACVDALLRSRRAWRFILLISNSHTALALTHH